MDCPTNPINAEAQEAEMALSEYEDFVYSSCFVEKDDPIAEWIKIREKQEKICNFLNQASEIHVVGEDTDLTFNVEDRRWINCCEEKNMPDGEVFTGRLEDSVNGTIQFIFQEFSPAGRLKTSSSRSKQAGSLKPLQPRVMPSCSNS